MKAEWEKYPQFLDIRLKAETPREAYEIARIEELAVGVGSCGVFFEDDAPVLHFTLPYDDKEE